MDVDVDVLGGIVGVGVGMGGAVGVDVLGGSDWEWRGDWLLVESELMGRIRSECTCTNGVMYDLT